MQTDVSEIKHDLKQYTPVSKKKIIEFQKNIMTSLEKVATWMIKGFKEKIRILQAGFKHNYLESPTPEIEKIKWKIKMFEENTFIPTPLTSSPWSDDFLPA